MKVSDILRVKGGTLFTASPEEALAVGLKTMADRDIGSLVVMDHVLGTGPGFTNRISRILRDEKGLAYSVNANIHGSAGILPGMFTAYIGTSPDNVRTAVAGFLHEMRRIRDEHGLNMACGASNVSFGMPERHSLNATWLPLAMMMGQALSRMP